MEPTLVEGFRRGTRIPLPAMAVSRWILNRTLDAAVSVFGLLCRCCDAVPCCGRQILVSKGLIPVTHARYELDPLIHSPVRFSIMGYLRSVDECEFHILRDAVELSDSSLSQNLTRLAEAGFVTIEKRQSGRRVSGSLGGLVAVKDESESSTSSPCISSVERGGKS